MNVAILITAILIFISNITNATIEISSQLDTLLDSATRFINYASKALPIENEVPEHILDVFDDPCTKIRSHGYPAEVHYVETEDGYILNLHRIPNTTKEAIPILAMHGVGATSDSYLRNSNSNESVAFILYEAGFDVWLGNWRGGPYTNHTIHTIEDKEFWDYSFEDMADKDLPAILDYILMKTKNKKIVYMGHSLGTTVGFCLFSHREKYNDKVSAFAAIAPVSKIRYSASFWILFSRKLEKTLIFQNNHGHHSYLRLNEAILNLALRVCSSNYTVKLCELLATIECGWNPNLHDEIDVPYMVHSARAGSSIKMYLHFKQVLIYNELQRFDYGKTENLKRYNSLKPPIFDLSKITIPTFLYTGPNDAISDLLDIEISMRQMKSAKLHVVPDTMFHHCDPLFANNIRKVLYNKVISDINEILAR